MTYTDAPFFMSLQTQIIPPVLAVGITILLMRRLCHRRKKKEAEVLSAESKGVFPRKLLVISMSFTLLAILWVCADSTYIYNFLTSRIQKDLLSSKLNQQILYSDIAQHNALHLSIAIMRADELNDYYTHLGNLHFAIQNVLATQVNTPELQKYVNDTTLKLQKLEDLSGKVIHYIQNNDMEAALHKINSQEYIQANEAYTKSIFTLTNQTLETSQERLQSLADNIRSSILLSLVGGIFLLVSWFYALRTVRRWQNELETVCWTRNLRH